MHLWLGILALPQPAIWKTPTLIWSGKWGEKHGSPQTSGTSSLMCAPPALICIYSIQPPELDLALQHVHWVLTFWGSNQLSKWEGCWEGHKQRMAVELRTCGHYRCFQHFLPRLAPKGQALSDPSQTSCPESIPPIWTSSS
jgi:hypothetical protein